MENYSNRIIFSPMIRQDWSRGYPERSADSSSQLPGRIMYRPLRKVKGMHGNCRHGAKRIKSGFENTPSNPCREPIKRSGTTSRIMPRSYIRLEPGSFFPRIRL